MCATSSSNLDLSDRLLNIDLNPRPFGPGESGLPTSKGEPQSWLTRGRPRLTDLTAWLQRVWLRRAASLLSGFLLFAIFPNLGWHHLLWVACLPLLLACLFEPKLRGGFLNGYLAGAVFFTGSCYWFVSVVGHYGGLGLGLSLGVLALFVAVFSVFFGTFGGVLTWMARGSRGVALIAAPFLWVAMELARTYLITGFPWNLLGYVVEAQGLRQVAAFASVYGLSFAAAATSALVGWAVVERRRSGARLAAVAVRTIGLITLNLSLSPPHHIEGRAAAVLVQANVPMEEGALARWAPWNNRAPLDRLIELSETNLPSPPPPGSSPLIVWPENPAPFYFGRDPIFLGTVEQMARQARAYAVIPTTFYAGPGNERPKNSAVVLDPSGRDIFEYAKIHLVPFGEYVPRWAFPNKIGKITYEVGAFVPGNTFESARTPQGAITVFICYEAIFPQLVRRLTAPGPGVLVNVSDDGWYGDSSAAAEHLMMARFRAIENGRYLLRATNNGITAVVDPYGRVVEELPRNRQMALRARFDYESRRTFYSAHGDVFAWVCVAVTMVLLTAAGIEGRRSRIR
ncbi:MAG: apolipoprotein N-acyltransferase [Acidobacteria bacterium]|nr:MAG: apolipoprotein N-acyltransferase [Acidobacteriota bacterium]